RLPRDPLPSPRAEVGAAAWALRPEVTIPGDDEESPRLHWVEGRDAGGAGEFLERWGPGNDLGDDVRPGVVEAQGSARVQARGLRDGRDPQRLSPTPGGDEGDGGERADISRDRGPAPRVLARGAEVPDRQPAPGIHDQPHRSGGVRVTAAPPRHC